MGSMFLTSGANDKISFHFKDQLINGINFLFNGKGHESSKVADSKKGCVIRYFIFRTLCLEIRVLCII